jgi:hypothetical protein
MHRFEEFENTRVVVYDFCESRAGELARRFLGDWRGSLTCGLSPVSRTVCVAY